MTESEVCLFLAHYSSMTIELVETFTYEYAIDPKEDDQPHRHRLKFDWLDLGTESSPTDSRPIVIVS